MNDYGTSPDLPDVRRVGRTFLGSRHSPDLPDVQQVGRAFLGSWPSPDLLDVRRVGFVSEALAEPEDVRLSGSRKKV